MGEVLNKVVADLLAKVIVGLVLALAGVAYAFSPSFRAWAVETYAVKHWAVWILFPMLLLLSGAIGAWLSRRSKRLRTSSIGISSSALDEFLASARGAGSPFVPNSTHVACIEMLRLMDDEWISARTLSRIFRHKKKSFLPNSDVEEALLELKASGWARDAISGAGREFKLSGPGLIYAREHGMSVLTESERAVLLSYLTHG
ncbi:hypothetical protein [Xanthomonas citri]|uniref:hypothetical protein n=1 Tax=Xanthomonas citri TaxID=346 RepID=UPI000A565C96|nr:hypothetical protein [Xanthomonas citri]QDS19371.1 hypothetical protein FPL05_06010 [Xanthomonas citri pv. glycines]QTK40144.1 hypothetical protein XcgCFBP7119R_05500 [Xanthomonas citri pv. glycines]